MKSSNDYVSISRRRPFLNDTYQHRFASPAHAKAVGCSKDRKQMRKEAGTRYSLMPTEPKAIVSCVVFSCLVAAFIFITPRIIAYVAKIMGVI